LATEQNIVGWIWNGLSNPIVTGFIGVALDRFLLVRSQKIGNPEKRGYSEIMTYSSRMFYPIGKKNDQNRVPA
jgi:hypothetical protein